jgi:outer membrane protein OmpA-like peptidoglycan-associated protein
MLLLALGAIALSAAQQAHAAAPALGYDAAAAPALGLAAPGASSRALRRELDRAQTQLQETISPLEAGSAIEILRAPDRVVLRIPAQRLFDAESTIPREDAPARALLRVVRQLLRKRVRLAGQIDVYTDGIGGATANLQFAQRRADALRAWFTEEGVPAARLRAAGQGPKSPIAGDDAPEGRMQNRRVEFVFGREPAA